MFSYVGVCGVGINHNVLIPVNIELQKIMLHSYRAGKSLMSQRLLVTKHMMLRDIIIIRCLNGIA